ncbi:MAG: hypothetical protein ACHQHO_13245 [Solirubrobacterales bacterium]
MIKGPQLTSLKFVLRMGTACTATILICLCGVGPASANTPAYISTAACFIHCRPFPLAQHPRKLIVGRDGLATGVRWTHWGAGTATGRGELVTNTGIKEPITIKVSHLVPCDHRKVYSRLAFGTPAEHMTKSTLEFDINGCEIVAPGE